MLSCVTCSHQVGTECLAASWGQRLERQCDQGAPAQCTCTKVNHQLMSKCPFSGLLFHFERPPCSQESHVLLHTTGATAVPKRVHRATTMCQIKPSGEMGRFKRKNNSGARMACSGRALCFRLGARDFASLDHTRAVGPVSGPCKAGLISWALEGSCFAHCRPTETRDSIQDQQTPRAAARRGRPSFGTLGTGLQRRTAQAVCPARPVR